MNCGYEIKWSYDPRSYERNFCNCVEKPEKFRTSTGFEPMTSRYRCDALTNWAMKQLTLIGRWEWYMKWIIYQLRIWNQVKLWRQFLHFITARIIASLEFHRWFIPHGNIRTHKWPAPNVSGFIAQLVRASHRYCEESLKCSRLCTFWVSRLNFVWDWNIAHIQK